MVTDRQWCRINKLEAEIDGFIGELKNAGEQRTWELFAAIDERHQQIVELMSDLPLLEI